MTDEIRYVGEMEVLHLEPDDVLVVSFRETLTSAAVQQIRQSLEGKFPGRTVLVLTQGATLGAVRNKPDA